MKFGFVSVAEHTKALKAKSDKIAELTAQLKKTEGADSSGVLAKCKALFGEESSKEGFDLEAKVKETLDYAKGLEGDLTTAQKELKAANTERDGVAKVLGHESAEGVDLVEEVSKIETEDRRTPVQPNKEKVEKKTDGEDSIICSFDVELAKLKEEAGLN